MMKIANIIFSQRTGFAKQKSHDPIVLRAALSRVIFASDFYTFDVRVTSSSFRSLFFSGPTNIRISVFVSLSPHRKSGIPRRGSFRERKPTSDGLRAGLFRWRGGLDAVAPVFKHQMLARKCGRCASSFSCLSPTLSLPGNFCCRISPDLRCSTGCNFPDGKHFYCESAVDIAKRNAQNVKQRPSLIKKLC